MVEGRASGEVEGGLVEKEVGVSGSVVDADEAPEVLVESLRIGIALPAVEVSQDWGELDRWKVAISRISSTSLSIPSLVMSIRSASFILYFRSLYRGRIGSYHFRIFR